jgi:hypothetical protein
MKRNEWHDYADLIEQVRAVDDKAAIYLDFVAPFKRYFVPGGDLSACFVFCETPQGHDYWVQIADRLRENRQ